MKKIGSLFLLLLALCTIGAAQLSYTGPGDRSQVSGSAIERLVCASTQYTGGPVVWRYRSWDNAIAAEGSATALAWQAAYQDVDDPATPGCNSGRDGVYVWQRTTSTVSYPAATFSLAVNCSAGQNGWCRAGSLNFSANEPIPGQKITNVESATSGVLCNINAASGNCSWTPPDGAGSANIWANSSFGDTSLLQGASWKMDRTPPTLAISLPTADGLNGWFRTPASLSLTASDATSGLNSAAFNTGGATQVVSTDGVNTVSASASDNAGNTATQNAAVKMDQTSPSITFTRTGTQGSSGWYTSLAKVTLGISDAASGIGSSFYNVDGGANINGGDGAVLSFLDGSHSFSARAWDVAGNSYMVASGLQVDTVPPTLSVFAPTPDGQNGWYINPPTFSLTASDATSGLASALFGNGQPTMTFPMDGFLNVYATAKDVAGNTTPYVSNIKKDSTPPTLSIPTTPDGSSGWFVTLPTLTLAANDSLSGLSSALFSNGKTTYPVTAQGVSTVSAQAADYAGNTTSASATVSVDTVPPVLSVSAPAVDGANGWYVGSPTFSLTASDAISGLASALFSDGKASQTISTDGIYNLNATAADKAGNVTPGGLIVKRDATPPSLSIPASPDGSNGWYVTLPTISLTASDATSGLASALFSNGKPTTAITADGVYNLSASALDNAGNSTPAAKTIRVDTTLPSMNVALPTVDGLNGWYVTAPTLSLTASDATSGIESAAFSGGGTTLTISADGVHTVSAFARDNAGNSLPYSKTIRKDATEPSLNIPSSPDGLNGWFVTRPTISLAASDATSGLSSAQFSNGQTTTTISVDGVFPLQATAKDNAGNTATASRTIQVDTVAPALYIPANPDGSNGWYVSFPTLSLLTNDATSGLASALFGNGQATTLINADGVFNLSASASDKAGNHSSATRTVNVDTTAPQFSFTVPYTPDGQNGWYVSKPTLTLAASDATSGLDSAAFESGGGSFSAADGTQVVSASAKDKAGNTQTISQTFKVDTIPPVLTPTISGPGANGWYNTEVTISLNTMDTLSGIGQTEYRLDGGDWHSGSGLSVSTEGDHTVDMRVTDNAGNATTGSRSFKLDTTKPISAFTNPPEGTQIKAAGMVIFTGKSADALSGLAATEISLDGGATWLPLPSTAGAWSYSWDTTRLPDGLYTILVHSDDRAGNRENTARVQVLVGNKPPKVEIQPEWWLWETGYIHIQPRQIPLRDVTLRIACSPYHPDVVLKYNGENFPSDLKWDRLCGNGSYAAESGDYSVTITACDTFGHCAEDSGAIRVPFIAPVVPTWTPTVEPSPTTVSTAQPSPTVQVRITVVPTTLAPVSTSAPAAPQSLPYWLNWALAILQAGLLQLACAAIMDPRPRALRRLGATLAWLAQSEESIDEQA